MIKSIKIPNSLASAIASDKKLKKAFGIYLTLKAIDSDGAGGLHYNFFITYAKELFKVHEKTIRNWLMLANELNLVNFFPHHNNNYEGYYELASWTNIANIYNCSNTNYYYIKTSKINVKPEYIIDYLAIKEKQKQCYIAAKSKSKNPLIEEELNCVFQELGINPTFENVKKCQQFDYLTAQKFLDENQRFYINAFNPDLNLSYKSWSKIFGYKSKGALAYKKRKLQMLQLINIEKRTIPVSSEYISDMTTSEKRITKLGHSAWFRPIKTIALVLCDNIQLNPQTQWKQPA